jgi:hypothetical protein
MPARLRPLSLGQGVGVWAFARCEGRPRARDAVKVRGRGMNPLVEKWPRGATEACSGTNLRRQNLATGGAEARRGGIRRETTGTGRRQEMSLGVPGRITQP